MDTLSPVVAFDRVEVEFDLAVGAFEASLGRVLSFGLPVLWGLLPDGEALG